MVLVVFFTASLLYIMRTLIWLWSTLMKRVTQFFMSVHVRIRAAKESECIVYPLELITPFVSYLEFSLFPAEKKKKDNPDQAKLCSILRTSPIVSLHTRS